MSFLIYSCKIYQTSYMYWNLQIKNHKSKVKYIRSYVLIIDALIAYSEFIHCMWNELFFWAQATFTCILSVWIQRRRLDLVFFFNFKSGANFVDFGQHQKKSWKTRMTTAIKMTIQMMATINGVIFRQKAVMLIDWASSTWKSTIAIKPCN